MSTHDKMQTAALEFIRNAHDVGQREKVEITNFTSYTHRGGKPAFWLSYYVSRWDPDEQEDVSGAINGCQRENGAFGMLHYT